MGKFRSILLIVLLGTFLTIAIWRTWRVPDLWHNWAALALSLLTISAVWASRRRTKREKSRDTKPKRRPLAFLFGTGALCVFSLLVLTAWYGLRTPAPMGEGPAGATVDGRPFAKGSWRKGPVIMVSLGDSVSTGYGAGEGLGYFDLLIRNDTSVYPEMSGRDLTTVLPDLHPLRLAANSTNSISHLEDIWNMTTRPVNQFGLVCITTGGIDLIHNYGFSEPKEGAMYGAPIETARPWIRNFAHRLDAMMLLLAEKFPGGCAVMLATIYDPTDGVGDVENAGPIFWLSPWSDGIRCLKEFNDAIRLCASKHDHVHLVDVHNVMLGHGIHCRDPDNAYFHKNDPSYWYYQNLEDPNQRGYDAIRREFLNAIIKALRNEEGVRIPD